MNTKNEAETYGEVDSIDFAIYLSKKALDSGQPANVTKIQKWLYICYGLYLAAYDKQLLTERPKAWDYGPAFPRVHKRQTKNNGDLSGLLNTINVDAFKKYDSVINATIDKFGSWTASELVAWTHESGRAWDKTIKNEGIYSVIDNDNISKEFKEMLKND